MSLQRCFCCCLPGHAATRTRRRRGHGGGVGRGRFTAPALAVGVQRVASRELGVRSEPFGGERDGVDARVEAQLYAVRLKPRAAREASAASSGSSSAMSPGMAACSAVRS